MEILSLDRPAFETFAPGQFPTEGFDTVELKFDGHNSILLLEDNKYEIWSRHGKLKEQGILQTAVKRSILYGEHLFGTEWAKDRPAMYGQFHTFGAAMLYGEDASNFTVRSIRNSSIPQLIDDLKREPIGQRLKLVHGYSIEEAKTLWDDFVVGQQYEGLIFRNGTDSTWGGRLGRMKAETTEDYVCMGFSESDADSYVGIGVRSIIGGLYENGVLVPKVNIGGITDEQRFEFKEHPEKYIGRVFEARGKKLTKKGCLRHPEFWRWRDDKLPKDCVWPKAA